MLSHPQLTLINLPVRDLTVSIPFYVALGFQPNQRFSDDTAACMVLSDSVVVMLLTYSKWQQFTTRTIPDAHTTAQVLLGLSRPSKAAVDAVIASGIRVGGKVDPMPVQDHGWMYGRSIEDPDGHIWEWVWMDQSAIGHPDGNG